MPAAVLLIVLAFTTAHVHSQGLPKMKMMTVIPPEITIPDSEATCIVVAAQ